MSCVKMRWSVMMWRSVDDVNAGGDGRLDLVQRV